jgi:hypothetical protein
MHRICPLSVVRFVIALCAFALLSAAALAQQASLEFVSADGFEPALSAPTAQSEALPTEPGHRFWDRQNRLLFSMVAASSMLDFAVTYSNLQNGGRELNPITRLFTGSTPALAVNFVGETAGVVGVSYFFHRTNHHRLERLTPIVNAGASGLAVAYGLTHRH